MHNYIPVPIVSILSKQALYLFCGNLITVRRISDPSQYGLLYYLTEP
jgi:hypothetical protein